MMSFQLNDDGMTANCIQRSERTIPLTHELINIGDTLYKEVLIEFFKPVAT